MKSIRCVFCSLSAYSGGRSSSFNMSACVHSWIEQRSLSLSSLNKFFFEHTQTCVPDKLDLSLCTVGTSSAFLQTADNICLLTCTVTCRTLLTLQMILPPNPTRPDPTRRPLDCPIPPSSFKLRSTNPVPSPQAARSRCELKLHFILWRLD